MGIREYDFENSVQHTNNKTVNPSFDGNVYFMNNSFFLLLFLNQKTPS